MKQIKDINQLFDKIPYFDLKKYKPLKEYNATEWAVQIAFRVFLKSILPNMQEIKSVDGEYDNLNSLIFKSLILKYFKTPLVDPLECVKLPHAEISLFEFVISKIAIYKEDNKSLIGIPNKPIGSIEAKALIDYYNSEEMNAIKNSIEEIEAIEEYIKQILVDKYIDYDFCNAEKNLDLMAAEFLRLSKFNPNKGAGSVMLDDVFGFLAETKLNNTAFLKIDLSYSDNYLIDSFENYLAKLRMMERGKQSNNQEQKIKFPKWCNIKNWHSQAILPYFDLNFIAKWNNLKISDNVYTDVIFPNYEGSLDNFRKTTKKNTSKIISVECLRFLRDKAEL